MWRLVLTFVVAVQAMEIIQGVEAPIGKYKYNAHVRRDIYSKSHCGASLIAPRFLLTAAHCAMAPIKYAIIGYHYNYDTIPNATYIFAVRNITVHPLFNSSTIENDIAVLQLSKPVVGIEPVLLGSESDELVDQDVTLTGWGITNRSMNPMKQRNQVAATALQQDNYVLIDSRICYKKMKEALYNLASYYGPTDSPTRDELLQFAETMNITADMLCINSQKGESPCHGDSGSPLVVNPSAAQPIQVGLASWLAQCGRRNMPTVFASIPAQRCFIDAVAYGQQWHGEDSLVHVTKPCRLFDTTATTSTAMRRSGLLLLIIIIILLI